MIEFNGVKWYHMHLILNLRAFYLTNLIEPVLCWNIRDIQFCLSNVIFFKGGIYFCLKDPKRI